MRYQDVGPNPIVNKNSRICNTKCTIHQRSVQKTRSASYIKHVRDSRGKRLLTLKLWTIDWKEKLSHPDWSRTSPVRQLIRMICCYYMRLKHTAEAVGYRAKAWQISCRQHNGNRSCTISTSYERIIALSLCEASSLRIPIASSPAI
jgi:hypothetical protein